MKDVFYENIDFLTLRMRSDDFYFLSGLVSNSSDVCLDFWFKISYFWEIEWWNLKVFWVLDSYWNKVACFRWLKRDYNGKKALFSEVDFVGIFWAVYEEYFDYFLKLLNIDRFQNKIVSRFDYSVDIKGVSVSRIVDDLKKEMKDSRDRKKWKIVTWRIFETPRVKVAVYNKKLDILDKRKNRFDFDCLNPFSKYLISEYESIPITRVEYRKFARWCRELDNSSVDFIMKNGRSYAWDYFSQIFNFFDGCSDRSYRSALSFMESLESIDEVYTKTLQEKRKLYRNMLRAYLANLRDVSNEAEVLRCVAQVISFDSIRSFVLNNKEYYDLNKSADLIFS